MLVFLGILLAGVATATRLRRRRPEIYARLGRSHRIVDLDLDAERDEAGA